MFLSYYLFEKTDYRGKTEFKHIKHRDGGGAYISDQKIDSHARLGKPAKSVLVWEREAREVVVDVRYRLNNTRLGDWNVTIPQLLGTEINAGWILWRYIEDSQYHRDNPHGHDYYDFLFKIYVKFQIPVSLVCNDVEIEFKIYAYPYIDNGQFKFEIEYMTPSISGGDVYLTGWDACRPGLPDNMNTLLDNFVPIVQNLFDFVTQSYTSVYGPFDGLYLLPGDGAKVGSGVVNVDEHASIALLPTR